MAVFEEHQSHHATGAAPGRPDLLGNAGVALEFVIIPVLLWVAIIVMAVWANFSIGAVVLGTLLLTMVLGGVVLLLRLEWRIEEEEGVHEETGHTADVKKRHDA